MSSLELPTPYLILIIIVSQIKSIISATALRFNNSPVDFEITVKNFSNDYAAFKVDLTAAGVDPNLRKDWYSLDPITSTLIPPGDTTKFCVTILAPPIMGIDLINLEVRVSSVELPDVNFHGLKLSVASVRERLKVYLPVASFAVYPRKILDIPVRLSNPNHYPVDVVLKLKNLDTRWLERGTERRLLVGAGKEGEISFICQSPIVKHTPCGIYPFLIQAEVNGEEWGQARGRIEILPLGTVFFSVSPEYRVLPSRASWLPQWKLESAIYQLDLKNASNVEQNQIDIEVEPKFDYRVVPPVGKSKPGETEHLRLEVSKKRPWWGLKRIYPLKITPSLSDSRLNTTNPSSQNVKLEIQPLLPLWLQLGLGAIATAIILWLLSLLSVARHSERVNSVTFSNSINPILSASTDGTVRQWKATPDNLFCQWLKWQRFCIQHQDILLKNNLDGVNVVKLRTENNLSGNIAFLGFDSGKASKLNLQNKEETVVIDDRDLETGRGDFNRILDIAFSPDLKRVFWGRGTKLLQWNADNNRQKELIDRENPIHVLTLTPDYQTIVAGGLANKIFRVELNDESEYKELKLHPSLNQDADRITGLEITDNNILITADNRGLMQFWDFNRCNEECPLLYSKRMDRGINAIAITKYGDRYYLVTGDDGGEILLWSFAENFQAIELEAIAQIARHPQKIRSIDLFHQKKNAKNRFLILSGSEDKQVRLDVFALTQ